MSTAKLRFVQTTNGNIIDLDNVAFILHVGVNEYGVVPKASVIQNLPKLDAHEVNELMATLDEHGLFTKVKALPRAAANDAPKLEVATK